jgi:hypothetical protein
VLTNAARGIEPVAAAVNPAMTDTPITHWMATETITDGRVITLVSLSTAM